MCVVLCKEETTNTVWAWIVGASWIEGSVHRLSLSLSRRAPPMQRRLGLSLSRRAPSMQCRLSLSPRTNPLPRTGQEGVPHWLPPYRRLGCAHWLPC